MEQQPCFGTGVGALKIEGYLHSVGLLKLFAAAPLFYTFH